MFHVELRQFPNVARAFNLSRDDLLSKIVRPWVSGVRVEWGDRRWDPEKGRIAIYEGRRLAPEEIGMGRGWANATRTGTEVTELMLEEARVPPALESFKAEVAELCAREPAALYRIAHLAAARHPEARASERLALAENAVWQLLHEDAVSLTRDGEALPREKWGQALLSWEAWARTELVLVAR